MRHSRLIVISLVVVVSLFNSISSTFAEDTALTLTATASSSYSSYYLPDKAVDNNESTYWVGGMNKSPWWINFDTGCVNYVTKINWLSVQVGSDSEMTPRFKLTGAPYSFTLQ